MPTYQPRQPVLADTTFQIGSIGKSMTALALMQHVESGRLDLNAPFEYASSLVRFSI